MNISEAPQDSVLRRHWEASRQAQGQSQASSPNTSSASTSSGGFFSWLKSLFS